MTLAIIAIFIFLLVSLVKTPFFKGVFGEFLLNFILKNSLDSSKYQLLHNITLPTEDGSTQIDHIVLSQYGVFVIETKNYRGWIFGNAKQKFWTQTIYHSKNKFQNPLHQNYKHIKCLEEHLNISVKLIHSIVVFVGDSTFKTEMPANVTKARGCVKYIKSKSAVVFSKSELKEIKNKIESVSFSKTIATNMKHKKHVKSKIQARNKS